MKFRYLAMSLLLFVATSCVLSPENVSESDNFPEIYPDYIGVTVPPNIAPLNFLLRDSCRAVQAIATTDGYEIESHRKGNEAVFDLKDWKKLMDKAHGKAITMTVTALN